MEEWRALGSPKEGGSAPLTCPPASHQPRAVLPKGLVAAEGVKGRLSMEVRGGWRGQPEERAQRCRRPWEGLFWPETLRFWKAKNPSWNLPSQDWRSPQRFGELDDDNLRKAARGKKLGREAMIRGLGPRWMRRVGSTGRFPR